ncbi:hypothetical protein B4U79_01235, partial [Dinothrombium tinctorium]
MKHQLTRNCFALLLILLIGYGECYGFIPFYDYFMQRTNEQNQHDYHENNFQEQNSIKWPFEYYPQSRFEQRPIYHKSKPPRAHEDGERCRFSKDCKSRCCMKKRENGRGKSCRPYALIGEKCSEEQIKGGIFIDGCPCKQEFEIFIYRGKYHWKFWARDIYEFLIENALDNYEKIAYYDFGYPANSKQDVLRVVHEFDYSGKFIASHPPNIPYRELLQLNTNFDCSGIDAALFNDKHKYFFC